MRERHALPSGDLDRAENQRNVIKAIVAKGLSAGVISDPATFTNFIGNVAKTSSSTTACPTTRSATALSLRLSSKTSSCCRRRSRASAPPDGQSIDIVDQAKLDELSKAMKNDTMDAYLKKYPEGS